MHTVIKFQLVRCGISIESNFFHSPVNPNLEKVRAPSSKNKDEESIKRKIQTGRRGNLLGGGKKSCPLCGTNPGAGEQVCPAKGSLVDIKEEASSEKERNKDLALLKRLGEGF